MKTYNDGLNWAADWIEGSLKGETDERVIEFAKNMAMSVRANALESAGSPVGDAANLQRRLFDECVTANWDPERRNTFAEEIAHLHEELSEAFRAWRLYKDFAVHVGANDKLEGVPIELADTLIGLFYNAELHGFDLLAAVEQKHQFNLTRNYVAEGRQLHAPSPIAPLKLYDRADGVKGHFCVGRLRSDGANEFWNKDRFCSAGEVFIGEHAAVSKAIELSTQLATAVVEPTPASTQYAAGHAAGIEAAAKVAETRWATLSVGKVPAHLQAELERNAIVASIRALAPAVVTPPVEVLRVSPVDNARVKEIRERLADNFRELGADEWRGQMRRDIQYLLALLNGKDT